MSSKKVPSKNVDNSSKEPAKKPAVPAISYHVANIYYCLGDYGGRGWRFVGSGTYGNVVEMRLRGSFGLGFSGPDRKTKNSVAVKTQMFQAENYDLKTLMREHQIMALLQMEYDNASESDKTILQRTTLKSGLVHVFQWQNGDDQQVTLYSEIEAMCPANLGSIKVGSSRKGIPARIFQWQELHFIAYNLILALHFLHHREIIHRDISLNNILADINPRTKKIERVVICDYGQARFFSQLVETGDPSISLQVQQSALTHGADIGKVHYRPPEGIYFSVYYNESWDIWQIGMVLLSLLTDNPYDHPYVEPSLLPPDIHSKLLSNDNLAKFAAINQCLLLKLGYPSKSEWFGLKDFKGPLNCRIQVTDKDRAKREAWFDSYYKSLAEQKEYRPWKDLDGDMLNNHRSKHMLQNLPLIVNRPHDDAVNVSYRSEEMSCTCQECSGIDYRKLKSTFLTLITPMLAFNPKKRPKTGYLLTHLNNIYAILTQLDTKPSTSRQPLQRAPHYLDPATIAEVDSKLTPFSYTNNNDKFYQFIIDTYGVGSVISLQHINHASQSKPMSLCLETTILVSVRILKQMFNRIRQKGETFPENDEAQIRTKFLDYYTRYKAGDGTDFKNTFGMSRSLLPKTIRFGLASGNVNTSSHYTLVQRSLARENMSSICLRVHVTYGDTSDAFFFIIAPENNS